MLADNGVAQRVVLRLAKPRLLRTPHPTVASGAHGTAGWFDPQSDALCVTGSGHEAGLYFAGRGKSRRQIRRQFLASVAGILVSFMALALLMTVLRLTNQALGWGSSFRIRGSLASWC